MSADGEVEVQVKAEGTEEAAQEVAGEGGVGDGAAGVGGGGQQQQGILGQSLRGGAILAAIKLVIELLGPIQEYIGAVLEVFQAIFAPLGLVLMRLLMPFLKQMIKLLPLWYSFMNAVMPYVEILAGLIGGLLSFVRRNLVKIGQYVWTEFKSWALGISRGITNLPRNIGRWIAKNVPGVNLSTGRDIADTGQDLVETGVNAAENTTNVNISGGLAAFVESVERTANVDLP